MSHEGLQTIGAEIAAARKAARRSQGDLAALLGMSRATISGIENGSVNEIGIRKVSALCAVLGLELCVRPKGQRPTLQQLRAERRDGTPGA
jgi:HTH-type transcriptional regulator / antitoxin HipB